MNISIAIMGHPKRRKAIDTLFNQIKQMPFAEGFVCLDTQNDEWGTGSKALQLGIGKADWHVVIQDDAILTPNFYKNIESCIAALPVKTLFSLYTGTSRPLGGRVKTAVDKSKDGDWLVHHQLFWGVGIVIPTSHIGPMLEFVEDVEGLQYDNRIGEFYCRNSLPVYYCIPSLVDHDDNLGSLLGHGVSNPAPRVAHRLATGPITWGKQERYI